MSYFRAISFWLYLCVGPAAVADAILSPAKGADVPAAAPAELSLPQAESLLLQRNQLIAGSRFQIDAARAARLIASFKPNPVVTMGAEQWILSPHHFASDLIKTNPELAAQATYTLRVDQIIERGGKRRLRMEQADLQLKTAEAQLLDSIRQQLFQLRQAFTSALLARENLRLARTIQQQYERTEQLTRVRVDAGDLARLELYRVRAGRLQFQQQVVQSETAEQQAIRDLLNLVYHEPGQPRDVPAVSGMSTSAASLTMTAQASPRIRIEGELSTAPLPVDLEQLRRIARQSRPDLIAARNSYNAAETGVRLARAQRARDIDIGSEYQRIGSDDTFGLIVQIPLFIHNNQKAAIQQAEALRKTVEAQLRHTELQVDVDVEKAFLSYLAARRMLELYSQDNLMQVDRLRQITETTFREGAVSLFELLEVQRGYTQALSSYNQSRADYQMSLWQMEQAIGGPLP